MENAFTLITWPESQELMDKRGFNENAVLINNGHLIEAYGTSSYLVKNSWLHKNKSKRNMSHNYLGDGVYVSFDGYHINLAVNHHENVVAFLDPYVVENLIKYINSIKAQEND